jgi:hypothetical protein
VNENSRPGEIVPEFHPGTSDVVVWESRSLFIHVTLVPVWMVRSGGANALFPRNSAPTGMTTDDDTMVGVGVGAGVGVGVGDCVGDGDVGVDEPPPPQAVADNRSSNAVARRSGNIGSSRVRVTVVRLT